jgi:hypothetical protein
MSTDVSAARAASILSAMMEAARTSETSVDNYFTRQYIPEDKSEFQASFSFVHLFVTNYNKIKSLALNRVGLI